MNSKRHITELIIHCSDTPAGREVTVQDITDWHRSRGFSTIGYHYVIYIDGSLHFGRPESEVGAHCRDGGHNRHSIGICYIGGRTADGKAYADTRTPAQKKTMLALLQSLKARYPQARVYGHRDFAARECPCFDAAEEYKHLTASANGTLSVIVALLFLGILFVSCRSTTHTLREEADSAVMQTSSSSVTSLAIDRSFQSLVLEIDSIVITSLPMWPVSEVAPQAPDNSEIPKKISPKNKLSSLASLPSSTRHTTDYSPGTTGEASPHNRAARLVIHGIRLKSNTADSAAVQTTLSNQTSQHSSYHSNVSAKKKSVPAFRWPITMSISAAILIAALLLYWYKKR